MKATGPLAWINPSQVLEAEWTHTGSEENLVISAAVDRDIGASDALGNKVRTSFVFEKLVRVCFASGARDHYAIYMDEGRGEMRIANGTISVGQC